MNRFKDKNPSPLNNLDFLLNDTYDQIIQMAMHIEQHRAEIQKVSQRLSCSIETVLMILKIRARLSDGHYQTLRNFLSPNIDD